MVKSLPLSMLNQVFLNTYSDLIWVLREESVEIFISLSYEGGYVNNVPACVIYRSRYCMLSSYTSSRARKPCFGN